MGRSSTFRCDTCKQMIYLGYAGYSYWIDNVRNIWEFNEECKRHPKEVRQLQCNRNVKKCLKEHDGHQFIFQCEDWDPINYWELPDWEPWPDDVPWTFLDLEKGDKHGAR